MLVNDVARPPQLSTLQQELYRSTTAAEIRPVNQKGKLNQAPTVKEDQRREATTEDLKYLFKVVPLQLIAEEIPKEGATLTDAQRRANQHYENTRNIDKAETPEDIKKAAEQAEQDRLRREDEKKAEQRRQ